MKIYKKKNELLYLNLEGNEYEVSASRLFPKLQTLDFISLKDEKEKEVCLIKNENELDESSRATLGEYFLIHDFRIEISKVCWVKEEFEFRHWKVETQVGTRFFQTKLDQWPISDSIHEVIILDLFGDLYCIKAMGNLDLKSQEWIGMLID